MNKSLAPWPAAVLPPKRAISAAALARRDRVARRYTDGLHDVVTTPVVPPGVRSAWAQYTIRVPDRDLVVKALADAGVPTAVYYPLPLHRQQAYAHHPVGAGGMAVSDQAAEEVLSLPMHPYLGGDDQGLVIDALRTWVAEAHRS